MTAVPRLFLDMDGVLADFDAGYARAFGRRPDKAADDVDWDAVGRTAGFYASLPPMPDLDVLWAYAAPLEPIVLTGIPSNVPEALDNKKAWVRRILGDEVPVIGCRSSEKATYGHPGDVLVDDWEKYRHLWVQMGGVWIAHRSAAETVAQLRKIFE